MQVFFPTIENMVHMQARNLIRKEHHMKQPQMTLAGTKTTFVEVWQWGQDGEHLHARIAQRFARPEPRR